MSEPGTEGRVAGLSQLQPSDCLDAIMLEDLLLVWSVGEFAGEILGREMELLVQVSAPPGAIGHIIDDPVGGNVPSALA